LLVDTHCHLFLMEEEPAAAAAAARASGVGAMVCCGVDAESSRRSRELADGLEGVFASAGVHPYDAASFDAATGSAIEELLADPRVVAVGETGLDHFRVHSPPEDQERAFRTHCGLARESGKALVVHVREAWPDALRVLGEEDVGTVVLHCFSGDVHVASEAAARGYFCSFAGNLTYPTSEHLRAAAAALPVDLILTETDSPYLPPQAMRGTPNAPANVSEVVGAIAEARGRPRDEVEAALWANAIRAFGLPGGDLATPPAG